MGFRIVYIEKNHHLRLYLDNLKIINEKDEELLIPLDDIQSLIVDNYRVDFSARLLNELCNHNVNTVICGMDHLPNASIMPLNGHFSQSGNILEQIAWPDEMKKKIQKQIVQAKLTNQKKIMIKYLCPDYDIGLIDKFIGEVEDGDPGNREGLAAKVYFRSLFGNDFIRFNQDVVNAGLNYGYSIFRSLISTIIVSKGYLPNIGLFHKGKENMFNLSDDIIEVFRPIVDDYVKENLIDEVQFTGSHKEDLIRLTTGRVSINGLSQTISNAITIYFESIINCIKANDDALFIFPDCTISYDI